MSMRRKGLTLIEVLIILVMVGILLTIVITKLRMRTVKQLTMSLQTDVHNVRSFESNYFAVHNMYGSLVQLDSAGFKPIPGHAVTIILTSGGYTATASDGSHPTTCTLAVSAGEASAAAAKATCE